MKAQSFRPLAGINYNPLASVRVAVNLCFRPLAGINCNQERPQQAPVWLGFRPLAGINCNGCDYENLKSTKQFLSPCGDKLQCCRLSVCPVCGKFPSPYGDGTNITTVDSRSDQFSPPYGDKLQWDKAVTLYALDLLFPSPCGDKLQASALVMMAFLNS